MSFLSDQVYAEALVHAGWATRFHTCLLDDDLSVDTFVRTCAECPLSAKERVKCFAAEIYAARNSFTLRMLDKIEAMLLGSKLTKADDWLGVCALWATVRMHVNRFVWDGSPAADGGERNAYATRATKIDEALVHEVIKHTQKLEVYTTADVWEWKNIVHSPCAAGTTKEAWLEFAQDAPAIAQRLLHPTP